MKLSDFKLLKEDASTYVVGHPKGKTIMVPKRGLSPKAQEMIAKLKSDQEFAKGGEVQPLEIEKMPQDPLVVEEPLIIEEMGREPASTPVVPSAIPQLPQQDGNLSMTVLPDPVGNGSQISPEQLAEVNKNLAGLPPKKEAPKPVEKPVQKPANDGMVPDLNTGMAQQEKALEGALAQEQKISNALASDIGKELKELKKLPLQNEMFNRLKAADAAYEKAYAELPPIEQNRIWEKGDTGSKIAAGIGMLLSGFGSGLSGQPNFAMENIRKAVENDIESQKNDQSKKMNLWKMNRDMLKNEMDADLATRNQYLTAIEVRMRQAAAQMQSPQAAERLVPAIANIKNERATNAWLQSVSRSDPGTEESYMDNLRKMDTIDPKRAQELRKRIIPGVGIADREPTEKEQNILKTYEHVNGLVDQAINFTNKPGATGWFSADNDVAKNIQADLIMGFKNLEGLGALTDTDLHLFMDLIPSPGAFRQEGARRVFDNMKRDIQHRQHIEHNHLGMRPYRKAPDEATAAAWAQRYLNDPVKGAKAAEIIKRQAAKKQVN